MKQLKFTSFITIILFTICLLITQTFAGIPAFDDCGPPPPVGGKPGADKVTVGYLAAVTGSVSNRQGRAISGALTYAIEQGFMCIV